MRLVKQENNGCVVASVAMLLGEQLSGAYHLLCGHFKADEMRPFPEPFDGFPRVPSVEELCDLLWRHKRIALVPFPKGPTMTPHPDCPPVPIYSDPDYKFGNQLNYGRGLIEGLVGDKGHMVAWDGGVVYDPRGYCYSINVADRFNFEPKRFWLAVGK